MGDGGFGRARPGPRLQRSETLLRLRHPSLVRAHGGGEGAGRGLHEAPGGGGTVHQGAELEAELVGARHHVREARRRESLLEQGSEAGGERRAAIVSDGHCHGGEGITLAVDPGDGRTALRLPHLEARMRGARGRRNAGLCGGVADAQRLASGYAENRDDDSRALVCGAKHQSGVMSSAVRGLMLKL